MVWISSNSLAVRDVVFIFKLIEKLFKFFLTFAGEHLELAFEAVRATVLRGNELSYFRFGPSALLRVCLVGGELRGGNWLRRFERGLRGGAV